MQKFVILLSVLILAGCAAPSVITGNSKSVVIDDGQYTTLSHAEAEVKAEADKWCAKYDRVSGPTKKVFGRRWEFECVDK